MKVPFADLKRQYVRIEKDIQQAIASVIEDTAFINGKYVSMFESNFAAYVSAKHCIGVGNGTDALFIALKSLGIGKDDEVLVPANTFVATSEAVSLTGARVVFVDCDSQYNMDLRDAKKRITRKARAIVPVHLYGQPMNLDDVKLFAGEHGLATVQDCAQAHGATWKGKTLADYGDILCYSFYPGKNLGAYGDAGAIVTNDDRLADVSRMFANHGRKAKYSHQFEGVNSRMDGIQGAILDAKLKHLEQWTKNRIRSAKIYDELLGDGIVKPTVTDGARHVYHLYVVRVNNRSDVQAGLKDKGIATGIHYPIPLPQLEACQYLGYRPEDFPVAHAYKDTIVSLPMFAEMTEQEVTYVCECLNELAR